MAGGHEDGRGRPRGRLGVRAGGGAEDPYALRYMIELARRHLPPEREGPTVALVCGVLMLGRRGPRSPGTKQ